MPFTAAPKFTTCCGRMVPVSVNPATAGNETAPAARAGGAAARLRRSSATVPNTTPATTTAAETRAHLRRIFKD